MRVLTESEARVFLQRLVYERVLVALAGAESGKRMGRTMLFRLERVRGVRACCGDAAVVPACYGREVKGREVSLSLRFMMITKGATDHEGTGLQGRKRKAFVV